MALKSYNGNLVTVTWLGRTFGEGRTESGFVATARNAERASFQANAEGGGTRSTNNNKSAKITLKFTQASDSHHLMTALFALRDSENVGAFEMRDLNGGLLERAARAWPQKEADSEYGMAAGERVWVLETDELIRETEGSR